MKFNGPVLAAMVGLFAGVQAFNVGVPAGPNPRQAADTQRSRWVSMSSKGTTAAAAAAAAAAPTKKRSITVSFVQETPGGYICGVDVVNFKAASTHRIVMSRDQLEEYRERAGKQVDVADLMTYVIKYMIDKGIKLENTEGMIEASVFPVNYFTLKQLTYFHDDVEDKIVELCKQAPGLSEF